jgi:hypothetical protein
MPRPKGYERRQPYRNRDETHPTFLEHAPPCGRRIIENPRIAKMRLNHNTQLQPARYDRAKRSGRAHCLAGASQKSAEAGCREPILCE